MTQPLLDDYGQVKWNPNEMWVPFNGVKRFMSYSGYRSGMSNWKRVYPFSMAFKVIGTERGRSSVIYWVADITTGLEYPLSFSDFHDLFMENEFNKGTCEEVLDFTFKKKGANYFIVPA